MNTFHGQMFCTNLWSENVAGGKLDRNSVDRTSSPSDSPQSCSANNKSKFKFQTINHHSPSHILHFQVHSTQSEPASLWRAHTHMSTSCHMIRLPSHWTTVIWPTPLDIGSLVVWLVTKCGITPRGGFPA